TAQFREQNLQDTPIAITAVSGAMLEARSQTSVQDIANQAPSVTLKPQGATFGPALGASIRGVGQFDFNPAVEPGVGFYVDDVYFATLTGSILDLLDLDRVEVLRGPQGTLSGRNSIGGAVKLFSKRPTGDNSGYVQAAYGSRNRIDLRGSADFNIAEGLDARIAGVSKKQRGYVRRLDFGCLYPAGGATTFVDRSGATVPINPAGGVPALSSGSDCLLAREGEVGYVALRGQLRYRPTDTVDINIVADYTDDDRTTAATILLDRTYPNGGPASPIFPLAPNPPFTTGTPPSGAVPRDIQPYAAVVPYDLRFVCGRYCNFATFNNPADGVYRASSGDGRVRFKGWGVSGQVEWDLTDQLQLVSITAFRRYRSEFSNDNDVSPLAHSLGFGPLTFRFFSQEVRLNGAFGANDEIEYTLGGYYSDQKSIYTSFQDLRSSALQFQQSDPVDADSKAVFAHLAWHPLEKLTFNGGIRYTEESKTYQYIRQRPYNDPTSIAANGVLPLNGTIGQYDGKRVDYRANVQYEWAEELMTYAQYSTGFKGGGVNPRPFFVQQALPFDPETLEAFELGLKSDLFDRRLRVNVAAFLSKYKGIQLGLTNCTAITGAGFGAPCALPVNAGDADIKGIEIETAIRPAEGFLIDSSVSYLHFKYKRFGTFASTNPATGAVTTVSVGGPTNINGPQFGDYAPYTPKWKWSIGTQYEIGLGDAGSLTPRLDVAFQGDVYANSANRSSNRIDDYIVANARLTWRNTDEDLEISGEVTNLFDKYYYLTINDQTSGSQGYAQAQPGRPREWAISMKKKF
ncbi:MAG: TonB-dependent receptor-like protein, partial [Sphingomonas bacterium]|nr:TonB-dependent receptor-like protein [Sphingomonas bacterium]